MAEFAGAGSRDGLELWRIEDFKAVKQAVIDGKFYQGDSYILLKTTVNAKTNLVSYAIHFWLGSETSQDESGCAAYKSVELDDALGGRPTQFREVEGNESQLFLSYFKSGRGIEYVSGGIKSGFRHVDKDNWPVRLLLLKGKRTVRVTEVALSKSSLNKSDVFILDTGFVIYLFNGPNANRYEKAKGVEVASHINIEERGGRAQIIIVNDDLNSPGFWDPLGGFVNPDTLPESPDDAVTPKSSTKLFKISDASGSVEFSEVPIPGSLSKELLQSGDVFLLNADSKVYVWVGSGASLNEKREATTRAVQYIRQSGLPANTSIERLSDGVESAAFKSLFSSWTVPVSFGLNVKSSVRESAGRKEIIDISTLLHKKDIEDTPVDDGNGLLEVWVVQDMKLSPVSPTKYGQFYGGDSYVLKYTYVKNRKEEYIIYFWLGAKSSIDEKGAAALFAMQKDDEVNGAAVQVRVVQGKEPAHFRQLFKGKNIIHSGGKASGFTNSTESDTYDTDGVALFHVRGTSPLNTQAVQVIEKTASLNSEDSFVLITPETAYVWLGRGTTVDEEAVATNVASILAADFNNSGGRNIVRVTEGAEPKEFWSFLGGQSEYATVGFGENAPKDPRLFHCSDAYGPFTVEEIPQFDQSDLLDEDVYILDIYTAVFVWIGSQSSTSEKAKALQFAQQFVSEANDGRDCDIPILQIHAGQEPAMFETQFPSWDPELLNANKFVDPYQVRLDKLAAEKAAKEATAPQASVSVATPVVEAPKIVSVSATGFFPYEQLVSGQNIPAGVDLTCREKYLDDATFLAKFGTKKDDFYATPKWKRDAKKKELGLF